MNRKEAFIWFVDGIVYSIANRIARHDVPRWFYDEVSEWHSIIGLALNRWEAAEHGQPSEKERGDN